MSDINKNLAILGLRPGAKQIEIKNAFRNLTLIYHPDNKETGSARKYLEIKDAYESLFDKVLYEQELKDLKKDPEAYYQARAKFPMAFEENKKYENTYKTTSNTNTNSNKPVPTYYTRNQKKPVNTTKTPPPKKKDNNGGDLAPFCIGGAVVAAIIALFSVPPVILIIVIALGAYWLLK